MPIGKRRLFFFLIVSLGHVQNLVFLCVVGGCFVFRSRPEKMAFFCKYNVNSIGREDCVVV